MSLTILFTNISFEQTGKQKQVLGSKPWLAIASTNVKQHSLCVCFLVYLFLFSTVRENGVSIHSHDLKFPLKGIYSSSITESNLKGKKVLSV